MTDAREVGVGGVAEQHHGEGELGEDAQVLDGELEREDAAGGAGRSPARTKKWGR